VIESEGKKTVTRNVPKQILHLGIREDEQPMVPPRLWRSWAPQGLLDDVGPRIQTKEYVEIRGPRLYAKALEPEPKVESESRRAFRLILSIGARGFNLDGSGLPRLLAVKEEIKSLLLAAQGHRNRITVALWECPGQGLSNDQFRIRECESGVHMVGCDSATVDSLIRAGNTSAL
jgi:hypothetical protein